MTPDAIRDLLERAFWTFVQAGATVLTFTDLSTARTAAVAGGSAVLSLLKTVAVEQLARRRTED